MRVLVQQLVSILRGLWLLRHPELVRWMGEARLRQGDWRDVAGRFPTCRVSGGVEFVGYQADLVSLGSGVSIGNGTVLAFGDGTNGFGRISVGSGTWIGQYNNLRACEGGDIVIGAGCLISQFCTLVASNHAIDRERPISSQGRDPRRMGIVLGDDVWLGAGAAIMPGVVVARGAVIGANAVVTDSVPEYEIWAGVPARKIGERE